MKQRPAWVEKETEEEKLTSNYFDKIESYYGEASEILLFHSTSC